MARTWTWALVLAGIFVSRVSGGHHDDDDECGMTETFTGMEVSRERGVLMQFAQFGITYRTAILAGFEYFQHVLWHPDS